MPLLLPAAPAVILPRRGILLPQSREEWSPSGARGYRGECVIRASFVVRACSPSGVVWKGEFLDREEFNEFITALVAGTLRFQPGLWRMPDVRWDPGLQNWDEPLVYYFTTNIAITSGTTWTVVSDWGSVTNSLNAIAGGGSNGGGGGAWSLISNQTYTAGHSITIVIGAGGPSGTTTDGGDTSAKNDANSSVTLLAKGGTRGPGGAGGAGGSGTGSSKNSGGAGGPAGSSAGGGGGGGGGSHGAGKDGGGGGGVATAPNGGGGGGGSDGGSIGAAGTGSNGGNGGNGNGGTGGGAGGTSGNGTDATANSGGGGGGGGAAVGIPVNGGVGKGSQLFDSTHGPGGGGGGGGGDDGGAASGGDGAAGGLYGGGGGSNGNAGTAGAGANGLLFFTYTPSVSGGLFRPNPMRGLGGGGPFFVDPLQVKRRH